MQPSHTMRQSAPGDEPAGVTAAGVRAGARQTIPIALGVFAFGVVFGVLARQVHLSGASALLMSALVFAGSAQFLALGLWVTPLPVVTIVFTTLIVNLRYLLMGAALSPLLSRLPRPAAYLLIFLMADENWALTMGELARGRRDPGYFMGSGVTLFVAWCGGTLLGRTAGALIQDPARWGLDFAFTAVFIALLVGLWKGRADTVPWAVAAVVAVAAYYWAPGKWYILLGGLAGSIVGALCHGD